MRALPFPEKMYEERRTEPPLNVREGGGGNLPLTFNREKKEWSGEGRSTLSGKSRPIFPTNKKHRKRRGKKKRPILYLQKVKEKKYAFFPTGQ